MQKIEYNRPWLSQYPDGVPADIPNVPYVSLADMLEDSFNTHAQLPATHFMGVDMTYAQWDTASKKIAVYLQSLGLQRGDRVAVMMPNTPQYMIAVAGILRAGMVLVNVNPLYTAHELAHQLNDSGTKAIFIVENFAHTLAQCLTQTPIQHVVVSTLGDGVGGLKGWVMNWVVRHIKKMVPAYNLPHAVFFNRVLQTTDASNYQKAAIQADDIAVLQYTGGTTGVAKGAVLLHRNILSNVMQSEAWFKPAMQARPIQEQVAFVGALPLYHIFAFTLNMMLCSKLGGKCILLPNPRDLPAVFSTLAQQRFHVFAAVNTLFNAMLNHSQFGSVNWNNLRLSVGGGMPVQHNIAQQWLEQTGCAVCEGYGLSETSPVSIANPSNTTAFSGCIGIPISGTIVQLLDENDQAVTELGQQGEIAIKGPQVMAGYWQRDAETANVMTTDGFFKTGDVGMMDERGYISIVDRKKDMILVSGFNVYPAEVEAAVSSITGVLECAAIGIPDDKSGEIVKVYVVRKPDVQLTEADIKTHCKQILTGYKRPRLIEFCDALPKSPVGKILRRELRDSAIKEQINK